MPSRGTVGGATTGVEFEDITEPANVPGEGCVAYGELEEHLD